MMKILSIVLASIMIVTCSGLAIAQTGASDSLTIEKAVALTLQNHATIRQAEADLSASEARIEVKRSDRYPDISFNSSYTRIGPVPAFDIAPQVRIEVAPYNNYDLYMGLQQTLYDFGRTDNAVKLAESSRQTSVDKIDLVKTNLAYRTIEVCDNILILHKQLTVLDEQLETLKKHQEMSVKRMEAGTATDFDTLTIRVRIAVVESGRIDAQHALETQEIRLRELTGLPADMPIDLQGAFATQKVDLEEDSLVAEALRRRTEMKLAHDAESSAMVRLDKASLKNKPRLALDLIAGLKNGYEPDLNSWRANYAAGVKLNVPVFNGFKTKYEKAAADADLNSTRANISNITQQITAEVRQAVAGVESSTKKTASTETQVVQAQKALSLASVRYAAGVTTNLDLLDAETTLSQAKLIHLRALYDLTVNLVELDKAVGKKVW